MALGCVNLRPSVRGSQEARFTQPRAHLLADIPVIHTLTDSDHCRQRSKKYKCDPEDDDDCRCDEPKRRDAEECCDASSNCRRNCCERCKGGTTRKSRSCPLCDDREAIQ